MFAGTKFAFTLGLIGGLALIGTGPAGARQDAPSAQPPAAAPAPAPAAEAKPAPPAPDAAQGKPAPDARKPRPDGRRRQKPLPDGERKPGPDDGRRRGGGPAAKIHKDLEAIKPNIPPTAEQKAELARDLDAIGRAPAKASKGSLEKLAENLALAVSEGQFAPLSLSKVSAATARILSNGGRLKEDRALGFVNDVKTALTTSKVKPESAEKVAAELKAIVGELRKLAPPPPVAPPAPVTQPGAPVAPLSPAPAAPKKTSHRPGKAGVPPAESAAKAVPVAGQ